MNTRVHEMGLHRRYFEMVVSGRKRTEVRVRYPKWTFLAPGDRIRFVCEGDECLVSVTRVAVYVSFEEMLDAEGSESVNPESPRGRQLEDLRDIYGPDKESLGVLAIGIEPA